MWELGVACWAFAAGGPGGTGSATGPPPAPWSKGGGAEVRGSCGGNGGVSGSGRCAGRGCPADACPSASRP